MRDLAVIIVSSPGEPEWLPPCLRSIERHRGGVELEVVVVENEPEHLVADLIGSEFPDVRVISCANRGFGHGNNRGAEQVEARYLLFLNPDTEVAEGDFASLLEAMDARPAVGIAGVRQVLPDGRTYPTARAFPTVTRMLGEALGAERLGALGSPFRERRLDLDAYDREFTPDWVIGSFMLFRQEAWQPFDERFFLYSEETDLCLRVRDAGWEIVHLPVMTIVHHLHMGRALSPRMEVQQAYARRQYADKHFGAVRRAAFRAVLGLRYRLRSVGGPPERRAMARRTLAVLSGRESPPFADSSVFSTTRKF